jgi:MFS transporter, CP family, cyanate transporter
VLVIWALPAVVGAIAVMPRLFAHEADIRVATPHFLGLVRDPLAWQVTAYFGLISALAYPVFNWGPSLPQARGLDATQSGFVLSVCYISQTIAGLLAPIVAGKWRDQRLIVAAMVVLTALGLLGFVCAPVGSLKLVAFVLGIGQGGAFGVALLLFALRTRDPHSASQLSALAQTVGYVFGGLAGPFAVGVIYDWTGSWTVVSLFFVAVSVASLLSGIGAGRARMLRSAPAPSYQTIHGALVAALNQFVPPRSLLCPRARHGFFPMLMRRCRLPSAPRRRLLRWGRILSFRAARTCQFSRTASTSHVRWSKVSTGSIGPIS